MYRVFTGGKFTEGLRLVNTLLLLIPLTVVDTRREVDELKELLTIARWGLQSSKERGWAPCCTLHATWSCLD